MTRSIEGLRWRRSPIKLADRTMYYLAESPTSPTIATATHERGRRSAPWIVWHSRTDRVAEVKLYRDARQWAADESTLYALDPDMSTRPIPVIQDPTPTGSLLLLAALIGEPPAPETSTFLSPRVWRRPRRTLGTRFLRWITRNEPERAGWAPSWG